MAVYVDSLIWEWRGLLWCHLTADTTEELHGFAIRLGLSRSRFQSKPGRPWVDHYDITEPKRRRAVALGAVEIMMEEAGAQIARKRSAARSLPDAMLVLGLVRTAIPRRRTALDC